MSPKKPSKIRADELVFLQGLAPSRSRAQALILAGQVAFPNGEKVRKAGDLLPPDALLRLTGLKLYVSRGGDKLAGALEDLGLSVEGLNCLDLGASTGGFTDCLLKNGALRVTALDVGRGLLARSLVEDERVLLVENSNARYLAELDLEKDLRGPFDLILLDLSFISQGVILPAAAPALAPGGRILSLIKPQFEVGRRDVGKRGVVRDPLLIQGAVAKIVALARLLSPPLELLAQAPSRLKGPKGNQEIFVLLAPERP
ncbi:MAG: TlyA family RNA methyltransferase [Deltaproteobacteria bacterium]|jgi:23S rRNA (cytidine1920-2'-O)/16S rRNA (cytidine1409-2'-O)-methyltransferase|nr:TlyA family RNA methyltransferase [Deltaproteobacteria bacterium]